MGSGSVWWDIAFYLMVFLAGALTVHHLQRRFGQGSSGHSSKAARAAASPRPANQIPVRGFNELVSATSSETLVRSIERRTKLSPGNWQRDCQPVLELFGEFVQMLPASESHHHAQPGGLFVHALEVVDAALTFRAGMEIPVGVGTEERKRDEHRWTVAVLLAALLHDVGKPVTDVRVQLFQDDPRAGRRWTPMAGSMRTFSALWYSVSFGDSSERDYKAHGKLGALLMQSMAPARTMRWLSESTSGDILGQLHTYLSGDDPDGMLGQLVKKADSDSVRRNLLHGPRTRFASARVRPLIERLMEALRRMLTEGGQLPLNRAGAAGWVHDGAIWFVCARLADEVRDYLALHESAAGIPGKDKNDRLFDTWQEHGAVRPASDGGAVWHVQIQCDNWSSPGALTVLCFPLDKLFADPASYPKAMNGAVHVVARAAASASSPAAPASPAPVPVAPLQVPAPAAGTATTQAPVRPVAKPAAVPAASPAPAVSTTTPVGPIPLQVTPAVRGKPQTASPPAAPSPALSLAPPAALPAASTMPASTPETAPALPVPEIAKPDRAPAPNVASEANPPPACELEVPEALAPEPAAPMQPSGTASANPEAAVAGPDATPSAAVDQDVLSSEESADLLEGQPAATTTPVLTLTAPLRPRERNKGHPQQPKMPTPVAQAFLAWVANSVGTGDLTYNEDNAIVHFVPEGALLMSPEIFRRFLEVHRNLGTGPIAELRSEHGQDSFKRLQAELSKSGLTVRNGTENLHYYQFAKADGSMSRVASFYLLGQPELLWNPVPASNTRIRKAARAKPLALPQSRKSKADASAAPGAAARP